jgi:5-methylcytosine-specific restriction endonuclease McrA
MYHATPPAPLGSVPDDDPPRHGPVPGASGADAGGRVLVLNATWEPINVCSVRRATVLLLKGRAVLLEHGDTSLHWANGETPRPVVIRLRHYVRIPHGLNHRRITRRAVFARDGWTCQYCGSRTSTLTVDHVIPRSKGGASTWENIVASCAPCNRRKGDRLPHQIDMHPRTAPRVPHADLFIRLAAPNVPESWEPYLPTAV